MPAPRKYPDELRERAIRLVLDIEEETGNATAACRRIGEELGINSDTLRGWVKRYARRFDPRLRSLNTAWLLTIVLVLFATRMLTAAGRPVLDIHALRLGFHAMLQVGIGGAAGDAAAHGLARAGAWCAAPGGDRPDPAVFMP